jgi:hypothetical protein
LGNNQGGCSCGGIGLKKRNICTEKSERREYRPRKKAQKKKEKGHEGVGDSIP